MPETYVNGGGGGGGDEVTAEPPGHSGPRGGNFVKNDQQRKQENH